jgi:hypothetical protein
MLADWHAPAPNQAPKPSTSRTETPLFARGQWLWRDDVIGQLLTIHPTSSSLNMPLA